MPNQDLINFLLLLVTAVAAFAAFRQIYISNRQKRADLILELCNQFYNDTDIQDIYYEMEYQQFIYDQNTFHLSDDERKLDKLLGLLSNIGQLYQMGIIKNQDLEFIKYEFQVVYETEGVQQYFEFLDQYFQTRGINHRKFQPFRDIGQKIVTDNFNIR
ncbi:MAG: hypothetical protein IPP81_07350 [Chitinophagaceae bacterium]|nr:hypothetical protein [Chitinophagaceae bacterium]MBL0199985.1 hypothetical protein [Chitinophagaceae bacterium]